VRGDLPLANAVLNSQSDGGGHSMHDEETGLSNVPGSARFADVGVELAAERRKTYRPVVLLCSVKHLVWHISFQLLA